MGSIHSFHSLLWRNCWIRLPQGRDSRNKEMNKPKDSIHSIFKDLCQEASYSPGAPVGVGNAGVNRRDSIPWLWEAAFYFTTYSNSWQRSRLSSKTGSREVLRKGCEFRLDHWEARLALISSSWSCQPAAKGSVTQWNKSKCLVCLTVMRCCAHR